MPLQARTREQIRVAIGYNLGAIYSSSASASGSTTTLLDNTLQSTAADEFIGRWIVFTSGSNDGKIARVIDSSVTSNVTTLTVHPAVTSTAEDDTYELWSQDFHPARIHEFINSAIIDATGLYYDPEEDISLHAGGNQARFDLPSELAIVRRVDYRSSFASQQVHNCGSLFDETTDSDFTQALDTEDKRRGTNALKLTIGAGVSAGDFVTDSIASVDLASYTHIEGWVKASTTLAAADFVIRLDNATVQGDSTDLEVLSVPATTAADTWTYFRVALANPESDTAIVSIGFEYNANQGANTVWFDDIIATESGNETWAKLARPLWSIDKEAHDLILSMGGRKITGYALLKLIGGDDPLLLTADGNTNEVPDDYVIARATELSLASVSSSTEYDAQSRKAAVSYWRERSAKAESKFPTLVSARRAE
jgi:hypothetical protein